MLDDPVIDRLPTVGRLLRLRDRYRAEGLEAACRRALDFGDPAYRTVKGILKKGLESHLVSDPAAAPPATAFVRPPKELLGPFLGGETWN